MSGSGGPRHLDPWQQRSLDSLKDARRDLDYARSQLGNDHPAYALLGELIQKAYVAEGLYS